MNSTTRVILGIGVVIVAVVLLVVLKDNGEDKPADATTATTAKPIKPPGVQGAEEEKPAAPPVTTIAIENGKPVGGIAEISVDAGETVRFKVKSPEADEVHVHGYDIEKEVPAGGTAVIAFPADIEGIFEVELHDSEEQIAELRVNP